MRHGAAFPQAWRASRGYLWFWRDDWDELTPGTRYARLLGLHYCFDEPPPWYNEMKLRLENMKMRAEERQQERDRLFAVGVYSASVARTPMTLSVPGHFLGFSM